MITLTARTAAILALALLTGLPMSPALAQEQGSEGDTDLADIEQALEADRAPVSVAPQVPQSFNPDLSFILDTNLSGFSAEKPLQQGAHDPTQNGFNFQQLELSLGSTVDPYWRLDGNLVFNPFGVEIEEIYATTLGLPANLQARAGQFLTRFGRINSTHPHIWEFVDQPLVIGKFLGPEGNFALGTELSWLSPLPWYLEVVGSATNASGAGTARSFFGANNLGVQGPGDLQLTGAIKQFFPLTPDWSLNWGLSGAFGPNPTGRSNRTEIYGTDLYLKYRSVQGEGYPIAALTTEAMSRRRQVPGNVLVDQGGYTSLSWQWNPNWGTAARYELVTGAAKDYLDPEWTGNRHRVAADVTYSPTEFSRIRLQGSADYPTWQPTPIYAGFLAFEVSIGAHGAHKF